MILDNGCCPCGHEVVDGDCVVWDCDGGEHRVPNSGPKSGVCRCCGMTVAEIERPWGWWWDTPARRRRATTIGVGSILDVSGQATLRAAKSLRLRKGRARD